MLNTIRDNIMLTKDALKTRIFASPRPPIATALIDHLKLKRVERVINGKPNTLIVLTKDVVVKMPMDEQSRARCRTNDEMLRALTKTSITSFVPKALDVGSFDWREYFVESRMAGVGIDLPVSNMDEMVAKAADFITKFHQETARDIVIDESGYTNHLGGCFDILYPNINDEYKYKLKRIEDFLRKALLGKPLKTVWFHGDYKIENVLFDAKKWEISGLIDWDLSSREGLPLLDIFYLMAYRHTLNKKSVLQVFAEWFFGQNFTKSEIGIINRYCHAIGGSGDLRLLLVVFWAHHVAQRYRARLTGKNVTANKRDPVNVCEGIDIIVNNLRDL